jgi:protein involved in polysaccharide export with SLBB domain
MILKYFLISLIALSLVGSQLSCSPMKPRELANPAQLPPSQELTEVRTTAPYILDTGDEVTVRVSGFNINELSRTAVINNSGEVYLPLLGTVKLAGKTVPQAREMVNVGLKKYYVDPQVEFSTNASKQQISVFGEVNGPGTFSYRRPLMIMEGIAKAGWFNKDANRKRVILIRRAHDKFNVVAVNTGDFFQDGSSAPEFYLQGGDVVYVTPSAITSIERFMQKMQNSLQPILTVEQMIILWPLISNVLQGKTLSPTISVP